MDLYVSRTAAVPAAGEEFVTPSGAWSDLGNGADDWTYTNQTATFNVVPDFAGSFDGLSSMSLVFAYNPAVMTYTARHVQRRLELRAVPGRGARRGQHHLRHVA